MKGNFGFRISDFGCVPNRRADDSGRVVADLRVARASGPLAGASCAGALPREMLALNKSFVTADHPKRVRSGGTPNIERQRPITPVILSAGREPKRQTEVEGSPISAFPHQLGKTGAERHSTLGSARKPTEIGDPSTPPMLPRSAQDDRLGDDARAWFRGASTVDFLTADFANNTDKKSDIRAIRAIRGSHPSEALCASKRGPFRIPNSALRIPQ
jgi:hypothetical protein